MPDAGKLDVTCATCDRMDRRHPSNPEYRHCVLWGWVPSEFGCVWHPNFAELQAELAHFKHKYHLFEECSPPDVPRQEFVKWCFDAWEREQDVKSVAKAVAAEYELTDRPADGVKVVGDCEGTKADDSFDHDHPPIHEVFAEIVADVPPKELAKLPTDGAAEHDRYLYGES